MFLKKLLMKKKKKKKKKKIDEEEKLSEERIKKQKEYFDTILKELKDSSKFKDVKVTKLEFEKDDDTNFHMDFMTAASNIRAKAYGIPEADKHKTKGIAGNIIPAMITTTALITGLVGFELIKLVQGVSRESFRNSYVNLAYNALIQNDPVEPDLIYANKWTIWDRFKINQGKDITLKELLTILKETQKLDVKMLMYGPVPIYGMGSDDEKKIKFSNWKISFSN